MHAIEYIGQYEDRCINDYLATLKQLNLKEQR